MQFLVFSAWRECAWQPCERALRNRAVGARRPFVVRRRRRRLPQCVRRRVTSTLCFKVSLTLFTDILHIHSIPGSLRFEMKYSSILTAPSTACGHRISHRKWKETKLLPGTAGPCKRLGCCLVSFHFLWTILGPQAVHDRETRVRSHST